MIGPAGTCKVAWKIALLALILTPYAGQAADCPEGTPTRIWIHVEGLKNTKGTVTASLYDSAKNFLKKGRRIAKEREPASTDAVKVCMPAPGPGTYAIALYHDENANRKFDRTWYGKPKEGHAFSNDARGRLVAPSYKAAAITVEGTENEIVVHMRY
jgi:uncharacterized protein (DUF2141 family)